VNSYIEYKALFYARKPLVLLLLKERRSGENNRQFTNGYKTHDQRRDCGAADNSAGLRGER